MSPRKTEAACSIHRPCTTEVWFRCCEGNQRESHHHRDYQQHLSCHHQVSFALTSDKSGPVTNVVTSAIKTIIAKILPDRIRDHTRYVSTTSSTNLSRIHEYANRERSRPTHAGPAIHQHASTQLARDLYQNNNPAQQPSLPII